jgi:oxaloacetate decarboxylase alpha subunit/pyruvate carboxylase subunit B
MDDLILCNQFPVTGKKFLEWKYGKSVVPDSVKPITLKGVKKRDALIKKAQAGELIERKSAEPPKSAALRTFNIFPDNEYFKIITPPGYSSSTKSFRSFCSCTCFFSGSCRPSCSCCP